MGSVSKKTPEMRTIVFAPTGRDAELLSGFITRLGNVPYIVSSVSELCSAITAGAGAAIVAEEVLQNGAIPQLEHVLANQPSWSDFPFILLIAGGRVTVESERLRALRLPLGNILRVERPARPETLSSALETALRSRSRQYQIRDQIYQAARAHEALLKSEKLAVTGRLAASIAHEINNPLEGVVNLLYLMQTENSMEKLRLYVSQAQGEIARVSEIAKHTLRFYKEPTSPISFEVLAVVDSVLNLYQSRLVSAGIEVEVKGAKAIIQGNPGELRQVLANLVGNSLDAMRFGGKLCVRVSVDNAGPTHTKRVRLTVADTGPGIPSTLLSKIFEPFVTSKGETGTGLGLWVTGELAKKNGWTIRVRTRSELPRRGTTFSIVIAAA
ncbi:MAG TPA: HAMP domain-containing sensor histidine kinase [Alloacidobacterium sp.]|nr:HAMP domain-containing sensor histidine kinase [Alloacidobacterium sp.]